MKVVITITHEVEAESWDLAVEKVLMAPFHAITGCKVKAPGKRLVHIMPGNLQEAISAAGLRRRQAGQP